MLKPSVVWVGFFPNAFPALLSPFPLLVGTHLPVLLKAQAQNLRGREAQPVPFLPPLCLLIQRAHAASLPISPLVLFLRESCLPAPLALDGSAICYATLPPNGHKGGSFQKAGPWHNAAPISAPPLDSRSSRPWRRGRLAKKLLCISALCFSLQTLCTQSMSTPILWLCLGGLAAGL